MKNTEFLEVVKTECYLSYPRLWHEVCSARPWLQVYLRPCCENQVVSISESGWSGWFGGNGMDGHVTEVTEMSRSYGKGLEVSEICGGYG